MHRSFAALAALLLPLAPLAAAAQDATPAPQTGATTAAPDTGATTAAPAPAPAETKAEPLPDVVMGDPNAPVTIVEYASMTCPHCAAFHNSTFKDLKQEYIDTGKAKFVLREFPFDPLAAAVFMLGRCSGDHRDEVLGLFFETQRQWAAPNANHLQAILDLARQTGMTKEQFETCLTDQQLLDGINAVKDRGYEEFGVDGTPTFFINGEKLVGERSIDAFRKVIDPLLNG